MDDRRQQITVEFIARCPEADNEYHQGFIEGFYAAIVGIYGQEEGRSILETCISSWEQHMYDPA
jgi:hypothetical protein